MKVTAYDCKPLHFFRKLPPQLKVEVDDLIGTQLSEVVIKTIVSERYLLETLYLLTPDMADHLTEFSDDYMYHNILFLYNTIQPVLQELFEGRNYYEKYPEYLV